MRDEPLGKLYVEVTGTETTTESQEESPSHNPMGKTEIKLEQYVSNFAWEDGLTDAVE